jgi:hypothetical protein
MASQRHRIHHRRRNRVIEIWTSRPNEERHGLSDPRAILFRAGARLTIPRYQKTA